MRSHVVTSTLLLALAFVSTPDCRAADTHSEKVHRLTGLQFSVLESRIRRSIISTSTPYGLKIRAVDADSPAAGAELKRGDILMRWDGKPIRNVSDIHDWILAAEPADLVDVEFSRLNRNVPIWSRHPWRSLEATIELPAPDVWRLTGLKFSHLDEFLLRQVSGRRMAQGLKIRFVAPDSPAYRAGLRPGDIVTTWNGQPIRSVLDVQFLIAMSEPGVASDVEYWKLNRKAWRINPNRYIESTARLSVD